VCNSLDNARKMIRDRNTMFERRPSLKERTIRLITQIRKTDVSSNELEGRFWEKEIVPYGTNSSSSGMRRKRLVPKLHLNKIKEIESRGGPLSVRETLHSLKKRQENDSSNYELLESYRFTSRRPELWKKTGSGSDSEDDKTKVDEIEEGLRQIEEDLECYNIDYAEAGQMLQKLKKYQETLGGASMSRMGASCNPSSHVYWLDFHERIWEAKDPEGLSAKDFTLLLNATLGWKKEKLDILFQKMDANGDEQLSWDEYISYLLKQESHYWEQSNLEGTSMLKEAEKCSTSNAGMISNLLIIPKAPDHPSTKKKRWNKSQKKYVMTIQGQIEVWDDQLCPESTLLSTRVMSRASTDSSAAVVKTWQNSKTKTKENAPRLLHNMPPTAIDLFYPVNRKTAGFQQAIVVAKNDRSLAFFAVAPLENSEESRGFTGERKGNIRKRGPQQKVNYTLHYGFYVLDIPQSMDVNARKGLNADTDMVLVGSSRGTVAAYDPFSKNLVVRCHPHAEDELGQGGTVKKVKVIDRIGVLSSSMDSTLVITDAVKFTPSRRLVGHNKGVYTFSYDCNTRLILTASYDRRVLLWDPFIVRPIGKLEVSMGSHILDIIAVENLNTIITASKDKKIKVWDIRTWKCIQTCTDTFTYNPDNCLSAIAYDEADMALVTAGSKLRIWPIRATGVRKKVMEQYGSYSHVSAVGHNKALDTLIVSINYSSVFKQIISVSVDENVILWDMETGKNVFQFQTDHKDAITAANLDMRGKRLLTAAHSGEVKLWNFNNGAQMHVFECMGREISEIIYLPRTTHSVVGVGWDSRVFRWPDPSAPSQEMTTTNRHGKKQKTSVLIQSGHKSDVRTVAFYESLLATGASDGEIIFWYVDSAVIKKVVHLPKGKNLEQTPGICKMVFASIQTHESADPLKADAESVVMLWVGTSDGSLHMVDPKSLTCVWSVHNIFNDALSEIAVNKIMTRVMLGDSEKSTKIYDISQLYSSDYEDFICISSFTPHLGVLTALIDIPDYRLFGSSSDIGEIRLWTYDGAPFAEFGQLAPWPLTETTIELSQKEDNPDYMSKNERTKRIPYFEEHPFYQPQLTNRSLLHFHVNTTMEERETKKSSGKQGALEKTLDNMIDDWLGEQTRDEPTERNPKRVKFDKIGVN